MKNLKKRWCLFLAFCMVLGCLAACQDIPSSSDEQLATSSNIQSEDSSHDQSEDSSYNQSEEDCPFEWVGVEMGHSITMLCDCCFATSELYQHEDEDIDGYCDVCGYATGNGTKDVEKIITDAFEMADPHAGEARVVRYYGTYNEDRYLVALIEASNLDWEEALSSELVGGALIQYHNGNSILVISVADGEVVGLKKAYENGWLSKADLAAIEAKQREFYPFLYQERIGYEVEYFPTEMWEYDAEKEYPCVDVCNTLDEYTAYCEQENVEAVLEYDEVFFEEKILIFVELATACMGDVWAVNRIEDGCCGELYVYMEQTEYGDLNALGTNHICIILDYEYHMPEDIILLGL